MQACHFSCPHCSAPLRVKDRSFVGQVIDCPDCGTSIEIAADGHDSVQAREVATQKTDAVENAPLRNFSLATIGLKFSLDESSRLSGWLAALQSPVGIAWSTAGVFGLALLTAIGAFSSDDLTVNRNTNIAIAAGQSKQDENPDGQSSTKTNGADFVKPSKRPANEKSPAANPDSIDDNAAVIAEIPADPKDVLKPRKTTEPPSKELDRPQGVVVVKTPAQNQPRPKLPERDRPVSDRVKLKNAADQKKESAGKEKPKTTEPEVKEPGEPMVVVTRVPQKKVDVRAALAQPILSFKQAEEVPFFRLLSQVEEMAGVPIRYDKSKLTNETLQQPIALDLKNTSVGGILKVLLDRAGLTYEIEADEIHLHSQADNKAETLPVKE